VTSPGYLTGGEARAQAGLLFGAITWVVTDLALMSFHPETRRMQVEALQAGVEVQQVRDNTGFDLESPPAPARLPPPAETELRILRQLDPDRMFLGPIS